MRGTQRGTGGPEASAGGLAAQRLLPPPAAPPTVPLELSTGHTVKNTRVPVSVGLPHPEVRFPHL